MGAVTPVAVEGDATVIEASWDDADRFAALYDRYAAQLYRYAFQRVGASAAEDAVADTFLTAFQRRRSYDLARPDARPWLFGILTRKLARQHRTEKARFRALSRSAPDPTVDGPAAPGLGPPGPAQPRAHPGARPPVAASGRRPAGLAAGCTRQRGRRHHRRGAGRPDRAHRRERATRKDRPGPERAGGERAVARPRRRADPAVGRAALGGRTGAPRPARPVRLRRGGEDRVHPAQPGPDRGGQERRRRGGRRAPARGRVALGGRYPRRAAS